jgi:hypothetical protein
MTTRPQNYVDLLESSNGNNLGVWNGWTTEMYTGKLTTGTNHTLSVPTGANMCHIVVNSGTVYLDIENAITSIPSSFTKGTMKLMDNQEANYYYLPIGTTSLNIYNDGASVSPVTVTFGRTRRMYQDVGDAFPVGDFG